MTLLTFIRLFIKRLPWLIFFPAMLAGLVFYLTKDMPKEYVSSTIVYTGIASGYNITETGNSRIDYFAVNNAFDNLISTVRSRETMEEVGVKLLAQHLLQQGKPTLTIVNGESLKQLDKIIPKKLQEELLVPNNFDSTVANINRYRRASSDNVIADMLNTSHSHYSVATILSGITVLRKSSSDMLSLSYKANDQGVCLHTIKFLLEVFTRRFKAMKGSETSNVVKYFEEQLRKALGELRRAEENLKKFGVDNRIINYHEQSKFLAESKEDMTTDYYKEVMRFGGAKAAVERLEQRMDDREIVVGNNRDLIEKRRQLAEAQSKLANYKIYNAAKTDRATAQELADLEYRAQVLGEELRQLTKQYYNLNNTPESVPINDLVEEWLKRVLEYEESSARLTVFEKRLKEYDGIYDDFAPLGSEITRLVRSVDVAEKEYLSVLHGLNMAKLRQQNLQMANTMTVMDEPFLPLKPQPSKRLILVIASFMAGFVLFLAFFVAQEMLDFSIRTPERAVKASGLTLAGALPAYRKIRSNVKVEELERSLTEQLVSSLTIALKNTEKVSTYYQINVFSARQGEGKTWFCERICNRFAQIDGKVLYLYPSSSPLGKLDKHENVVAISYDIDGSYVGTKDVQSMLENTEHSSFEFSYVFIEIPYLSHNTVPYDLVAQAHTSLLVMNAEKVWASAHERTLGLYQKAAKNDVMLMLNRVTPEMLESVYGEIPKSRSTLRRLIKKIVSMGAI